MLVLTTESEDPKLGTSCDRRISKCRQDFIFYSITNCFTDDDYELSGQLFQTDSYAVSELLTDMNNDDETKDPVTVSSESATLSSAAVYVNSSNGSNKLHTIVLHLAGQQASGVQALINVQCLVHSLDLPVVFLEPVMVLNKFKAMPLVQFDISGNPMTRESQSNLVVHFSDLFDLDIFNKFSSDMYLAQVAPREVFFANAPRKILFIHLYQGWISEAPRMILLWPEQNRTAGGCFDPVKSHLESDARYQLRLLIHKGFCVVKVVKYRVEGGGQGFVFSETELRESILGDLSYSDFTLVFSIWMPKYVLPGPKGLQCIHSGYHSSKGQFQPSKRLLQSAKYYKEHFLNSTKDHLTLMIRLEHLYTFVSRPRQDWNVKKCLDAAIAKVKELQNEHNFGKPFVTLDIGKYGSKSLRRNIGRDNVRSDTQYINELLSSVYDGQWSMREWENSFIEATGGIDESSYIAALQRTLASKAECLVLVGGGMFQELTMRKYMESRNKEDRCIHLLCLKNDVNSEIANS